MILYTFTTYLGANIVSQVKLGQINMQRKTKQQNDWELHGTQITLLWVVNIMRMKMGCRLV